MTTAHVHGLLVCRCPRSTPSTEVCTYAMQCRPVLCVCLTYLDSVPPVLIRTLGDELSPSGTVVGSISRVISINTQSVRILLQCVLPCPLWSSGPPATFWSPCYGQTSWSGCRESQDVPNKSSSSGSYCVMHNGYITRRKNLVIGLANGLCWCF